MHTIFHIVLEAHTHTHNFTFKSISGKHVLLQKTTATMVQRKFNLEYEKNANNVCQFTVGW